MIKIYRRLMVGWVVIFVAFGLAGRIARAEEVALSQLDISVSLVDLPTRSSKLLPKEEVELSTTRIAMKANETVDGLLTLNGVYPDGESLALVSRLNRNVLAKKMKEGDELVLPTARLKKEESALQGHLIAVTLDKSRKQAFFDKVKALSVAAESLQDLAQKTDEVQGRFQNSVGVIASGMGSFRIVIRERTRPISSEMISQMCDEADVVGSLVAKVNSGGSINKDDIDSVELSAKNMGIRLKSLEEAKGTGGMLSLLPDIRVSVSALKEGKTVNGLRVYYVAQGLWKYRKKYEHSFDKLTSPSEKFLPVADYYIWAGKPGDSTPISDRADLQVRSEGERKVMEKELSILK